MGDLESNHENCVAHSGQEERIRAIGGKMNLVLWLLGILIAIIISLGGALYNSVQAVSYAIAGYGSKFSAIEAKIQQLDGTDQRLLDRLERLEQPR